MPCTRPVLGITGLLLALISPSVWGFPRVSPLFAMAPPSVAPASAAAERSEPEKGMGTGPENADRGVEGYYRYPTLHGDRLVFTAAGDLWRVDLPGRQAHRLTRCVGEETHAAIRPDGGAVVFSAEMDGPTEVYLLPLSGGTPKRLTYDGAKAQVAGWAGGKVVYATSAFSPLGDVQLVTVDPSTLRQEVLPLAQASQGCLEGDGRTWCFCRFPGSGGWMKGYRGGARAQLWRYDSGDAGSEAVRLSPATSAWNDQAPMWWAGRIFFVSDRSGSGNLHSVRPDGSDHRQLTFHRDLDALSPCMSQGRIVYRLGADLRLYTIAAERDEPLPIRLEGELTADRPRLIEAPEKYLQDAALAPGGDRVAVVARGRAALIGLHPRGRTVEFPPAGLRQEQVGPEAVREREREPERERVREERVRSVRFLPDGQSVLMLSDASGEYEFWIRNLQGDCAARRITQGSGALLRHPWPAPDGRKFVYQDQRNRLRLVNIADGVTTEISQERFRESPDAAWSPDGRYLAYTHSIQQLFPQIWIYDCTTRSNRAFTSERFPSYAPVWESSGKWLFFASERYFGDATPSPVDLHQSEPWFQNKSFLYHCALFPGYRSPFALHDELHPPGVDPKLTQRLRERERQTPASGSGSANANAPAKTAEGAVATASKVAKADKVEWDPDWTAEAMAKRMWQVPVSAGNYRNLQISGNSLFYVKRSAPAANASASTSMSAPVLYDLFRMSIHPTELTPKLLAKEILRYDASQDGRKALVIREQELAVIDTQGPTVSEPGGAGKVPLSAWRLSIVPRYEWRQIFEEAWRIQRDLFYDKEFGKIDWVGVRKRYLPMLDRIQSREELNDLLGMMVSELRVSHQFIRGGDTEAPAVGDLQKIVSLGGRFQRDDAAGGYRLLSVDGIDPEEPESTGPLQRAWEPVQPGDILLRADGRKTLECNHIGELLLGKVNQYVMLDMVRPGTGEHFQNLVRPEGIERLAILQRKGWIHTRRKQTETASKGRIGYIHLTTFTQVAAGDWSRQFASVFHKEGLILDLRHNLGGNVDHWILDRLMRSAWFTLHPRDAGATWSMPFAFRGHLAVLCDEHTASDAEVFLEGVRRFHLGTIIGTQTMGAGIWILTQQNREFADRGTMTIAEIGMASPEGRWMIEGHGVTPDIVADTPPHAAFLGRDQPLESALEFLTDRIQKEPIPEVVTPPHSVRTPNPGPSAPPDPRRPVALPR